MLRSDHSASRDFQPEGSVSVDPRVLRTRKHVLDSARELLVEHGPAGMTFTALAARAQVARQTLYRYWDGPEALVGDLIRRDTPEPVAGPGTVRETLRGFLVDLREVLADPAAVGALGMLMAGAEHNPAAARALQDVGAARLEWLNERLDGLRPPLTEEDYAALTGPLVYTRLTARRDISDRLIDRTVDLLA
jgi:AcrR family transcriptional regulator